jgi:hypothetical protein
MSSAPENVFLNMTREEAVAFVKAQQAALIDTPEKLEALNQSLARDMEAASRARMAADYEEVVRPILPAKKAKKPTKKELREAEERADSKTGRTCAEVAADMKVHRLTGRPLADIIADRQKSL